MGYHTLLLLQATRDGEILNKDEFTELLNQIDDPDLDKRTLLDIYGDGQDTNSARWLRDSKDKLMSKVSSHCPELTFELLGDGEEQGDEWSESWKNGRRIELSEKFGLAEFIMDKLKEEHPEIYQDYVKQSYQKEFYIFDDKKIIYNGLEVENTKYQEDPINVHNQIFHQPILHTNIPQMLQMPQMPVILPSVGHI